MAQATACLSPSGNRRNGRAHPYDRAKATQWLLQRCPTSDFPDLTDATPAGRAGIIAMLRKVCVKMRAHGLRGEWHYSLPLHTELWRILQAEEVELAAIREELAAQVRHQRFAGHLPRPAAKAGSVEPAMQRASRVIAPPARP